MARKHYTPSRTQDPKKAGRKGALVPGKKKKSKTGKRHEMCSQQGAIQQLALAQPAQLRRHSQPTADARQQPQHSTHTTKDTVLRGRRPAPQVQGAAARAGGGGHAENTGARMQVNSLAQPKRRRVAQQQTAQHASAPRACVGPGCQHAGQCWVDGTTNSYAQRYSAGTGEQLSQPRPGTKNGGHASCVGARDWFELLAAAGRRGAGAGLDAACPARAHPSCPSSRQCKSS